MAPDHHLLDALQAQLDELVPRIVAAVRASEPDAYTRIGEEELRVAARANVLFALAALRVPRPPSEDERAAVAAYGELRAKQGLSLQALLRGIRIGVGEAIAVVQDAALQADAGADELIVLMGSLWEWTDDISVTLAAAHRRIELARARSDEQQRSRFVHAVIAGGRPADRLAEEARAFRLDPDTECVIVRARPSDEHPAAAIERTLLPTAWAPGVLAAIEDDIVAVLPASAVADTMVWPFAAGISPAGTLGGGERAFRLATRLLDATLALSLAGPCRITDVGLKLAVLGEPDLTAILRQRYVEPVLAQGAFGSELLASVARYLEAEQNIDAAAASLYVHPNTLRHRLARYEEITGARLRNPEQLAEIWWATQDQLMRSAANGDGRHAG